MPEDTPSTRHQKRARADPKGESLVEGTSALEGYVRETVEEFFQMLRCNPAYMAATSSGTGGPPLQQGTYAAFQVEVLFPLMDDSDIVVQITSATKVGRLRHDHTTFVWKKPFRPG
jgi:hypothetical protein